MSSSLNDACYTCSISASLKDKQHSEIHTLSVEHHDGFKKNICGKVCLFLLSGLHKKNNMLYKRHESSTRSPVSV